MLLINSSTQGHNWTSANITNPREEKIGNAVSCLSFTFLVLILIMALFGNTLVIVAFVLYSKLKTVTNYFVVSLAISDIWISLFSMTTWAAFLLTGKCNASFERRVKLPSASFLGKRLKTQNPTFDSTCFLRKRNLKLVTTAKSSFFSFAYF